METGKKNIKLTKISVRMRKIIKDESWFNSPSKMYAFAVSVHLKKFKSGEAPSLVDIDAETGLAANTFDPDQDLSKLVRIYHPSAEKNNDTIESWINSGFEIMYANYIQSTFFDLEDYFPEE